MERISIIGSTGAGKSTLAERLAGTLGCDYIDLDALNWGPNWTPAPVDILRRRVAEALAGVRWVVAGNYSSVRAVVWPRADTLIWLDYSLQHIYPRLFRRTMRRILLRESLWGGNRESFRTQFAGRDSLFLYAATSYNRHRRETAADLARPEYAHLRVIHFRQPSQTDQWLKELSLTFCEDL
ncbi:MAG: adenylate kinase [Anaerolineae bacterium]|nr:adenylate kinase [Anaerolineae bacterium]